MGIFLQSGNNIPADAFLLFSLGEDPVGDRFLDPIVSFLSVFPDAVGPEFLIPPLSVSSPSSVVAELKCILLFSLSMAPKRSFS